MAILILTSCDDVPELHPHVADFKLNEVREYKVTDRRELKVKFKQLHPIEKAHGMWCLPPEDIVALKEYWRRQNKEQYGNNYN